MAKYCVYCYNGIHKTYYRKSNDFILTEDYRKCARCDRQRRLVEFPLFCTSKPQLPVYHPTLVRSLNLYMELSFLILKIVVCSYRLCKKMYKKITKKSPS